MQTKECTTCNLFYDLTHFCKKVQGKFGVNSVCRECRRILSRKYEATHKKERKKWEKRLRQSSGYKLKRKEYIEKNKDKIREYNVNYNKINIESRRIYNREYARDKRKNDPNFRIAKNLRNRVLSAIKRDQKVGSAVTDLGCSVEQLKLYLESKFQPGMSWDNYTKNGWHIDHIIPLSKFDLTDRNQFLRACHYTNLQPLWAIDNWRKNNK